MGQHETSGLSSPNFQFTGNTGLEPQVKTSPQGSTETIQTVGHSTSQVTGRVGSQFHKNKTELKWCGTVLNVKKLNSTQKTF